MLAASRRAREVSSRSLCILSMTSWIFGAKPSIGRLSFLPPVRRASIDGSAGHVPRTDLEPQRYAAGFPFVVLRPRLDPFPRVEVDADAGSHKLLPDAIGGLEHAPPLVAALVDRHDHDLVLREARGRDQPEIVSVRHDERADQSGRDAPGGVPHVVEPTRRGLERDLERPREILAEVVTGARLQRAVVLHQPLAAVRAQGAGEALAVGLPSGQHRHRHPLLHEGAVDPEHRGRSPPPPRLPWRGPCAPPARGTRSCGGTGGFASPTEPRWPTG